MIQKAIEAAVNKALGMEANDDHVTMKACRIVILDRGWVVVGWVGISGDDVTIEKASVIRVWGTSKGIGEIASGGPTKDTILDPLREVAASIDPALIQRMRGGRPDEQTGGWSE